MNLLCNKLIIRDSGEIEPSGKVFCSNSCAAKINNKIRKLHKQKHYCVNKDCKKETKHMDQNTITTKRKLMDTIGWGFIFWLIGFTLGMIFFPFVPVKYIGLPILAVYIPLTIFIAYKRFKKFGAPTSYYFLVASVWLVFALVLDYIFIVKAFKSENYYDFDVMIYYLATFLIPLIVGFKYGRKETI